jgi:hypothetical protein
VHGPPNPPHIDAVEQHRQLGGVHLDRAAVAREAWRSKFPALQPLIIEDKAATIPKQNLATIATSPQKNKQMPGEQVHPPLPANDATQAVVTAAEIDRLNRKIDPNTRRKRQQRLSQSGNDSGHVGWIATLLETKSKPGAELELDQFGRGAAHPHRQERQRVALRNQASRRLVQVVFQSGVGHAVLGRDLGAREYALFRLRYDARPKFDSAR